MIQALQEGRHISGMTADVEPRVTPVLSRTADRSTRRVESGTIVIRPHGCDCQSSSLSCVRTHFGMQLTARAPWQTTKTATLGVEPRSPHSHGVGLCRRGRLLRGEREREPAVRAVPGQEPDRQGHLRGCQCRCRRLQDGGATVGAEPLEQALPHSRAWQVSCCGSAASAGR